MPAIQGACTAVTANLGRRGRATTRLPPFPTSVATTLTARATACLRRPRPHPVTGSSALRASPAIALAPRGGAPAIPRWRSRRTSPWALKLPCKRLRSPLDQQCSVITADSAQISAAKLTVIPYGHRSFVETMVIAVGGQHPAVQIRCARPHLTLTLIHTAASVGATRRRRRLLLFIRPG